MIEVDLIFLEGWTTGWWSCSGNRWDGSNTWYTRGRYVLWQGEFSRFHSRWLFHDDPRAFFSFAAQLWRYVTVVAWCFVEKFYRHIRNIPDQFAQHVCKFPDSVLERWFAFENHWTTSVCLFCRVQLCSIRIFQWTIYSCVRWCRFFSFLLLLSPSDT